MKLCWHKYSPLQTFCTRMLYNGEHMNWVVSITGHQCEKCGKRKLQKHRNGQSPGATQEAYDWLNKPKLKGHTTIIKLVKK